MGAAVKTLGIFFLRNHSVETHLMIITPTDKTAEISAISLVRSTPEPREELR